jgi:hypothetical protein
MTTAASIRVSMNQDQDKNSISVVGSHVSDKEHLFPQIYLSEYVKKL